MRWDAVMEAVVAALDADADFAGVFGTDGFLAGERPHRVPSWDWMLVVDTEDELDEEVEVQFDLYTHSLTKLRTAERALRRLLVRDRPYTLGGERIRVEFVAGRRLDGPSDDRYFRRSLDIRLTAIRSRYH